MNLLAIAERDAAFILQDADKGFGVPITVTDPTGKEEIVNGRAGDVHALIDPDTGAVFSVRNAHCTFNKKTLLDLGFQLPQAEPDTTKKPWKFKFADRQGLELQFTVSETRPDNTLGIITLMLELFKDAT